VRVLNTASALFETGVSVVEEYYSKGERGEQEARDRYVGLFRAHKNKTLSVRRAGQGRYRVVESEHMGLTPYPRRWRSYEPHTLRDGRVVVGWAVYVEDTEMSEKRCVDFDPDPTGYKRKELQSDIKLYDWDKRERRHLP